MRAAGCGAPLCDHAPPRRASFLKLDRPMPCSADLSAGGARLEALPALPLPTLRRAPARPVPLMGVLATVRVMLQRGPARS